MFLYERRVLTELVPRGYFRLPRFSDIRRLGLGRCLVRLRDAIGLGLQSGLAARGRSHSFERRQERLLNLVDVVTACCQRRLQALLQLGAYAFRRLQSGVVARRFFFEPFVTLGECDAQGRERYAVLG